MIKVIRIPKKPSSTEEIHFQENRRNLNQDVAQELKMLDSEISLLKKMKHSNILKFV